MTQLYALWLKFPKQCDSQQDLFEQLEWKRIALSADRESLLIYVEHGQEYRIEEWEGNHA